jgi:PAS domain S-box-containing protein
MTTTIPIPSPWLKEIEMPHKRLMEMETCAGRKSTEPKDVNGQNRAQIRREVSERNHPEKVLREREGKLQSIFRASPIGIGLVSYPDRLFLEVNERLCRMVGYSPEELVGNSARMLYPTDEDFQRVKRDKYAQMETQGTGTVETRWQRKDGVLIEVLLSSAPLDEQDYSLGVTFTALDITERKQIEQALRTSEERYRAHFENVSDVICSLDRQLRIIDVSPSVERLIGYSPDELIGRPITELPILSPRYLAHALADIQQVLAGNRVESREYELYSRDGSLKWSEISTAPLIVQGEVVGIVSVARDISEQRRDKEALQGGEDHLSALVNSSTDAIISLDIHRVITKVNPAFLKQFGCSCEEAVGQSMDIFHMDRAAFEEFGSRVYPVIKAKGHWLGEWVYRRQDGSRLPMETVISAIRHPDGEISGYVSVMRDITERIKAETEKTALERKLRQAQKMESIGTLAGGIAHDFNNILGAIMGYTELALMDTQEEDPIRESMVQVRKATFRARDLIKQIMAFSRQGEQEMKAVQLGMITQEALKLLRATIPTTIEIRQQLREKDSWIMGDPIQIHQVLMNLCTNALQAMEGQKGLLEVGLERVELDRAAISHYPGMNPGPHLRLTISDNGAGIDSQIIDRIFDPFFTTKGLGEGTGMGLAVVHGIVKNHGGMITVYSEKGAGTTFHSYFPSIHQDGAGFDLMDSGSLLPGKEHILFVDDEEFLINVGRQMLERLGYRVTSRLSGPEALELFRAHPDRFDLVITDQTMPQITGVELSRELMAIRPNIPIVLCTGFSEGLTAERAKNIGIRDFIMKPIVLRDLSQMIRRVLAGTTDTG